ncbi:hypothetical protein B0H13DRAFT_1900181 [Mycena leptocephala]|nr:hypothetical protein B0H13DRAFT_1900181 [Mycena leptocephala]
MVHVWRSKKKYWPYDTAGSQFFGCHQAILSDYSVEAYAPNKAWLLTERSAEGRSTGQGSDASEEKLLDHEADDHGTDSGTQDRLGGSDTCHVRRGRRQTKGKWFGNLRVQALAVYIPEFRGESMEGSIFRCESKQACLRVDVVVTFPASNLKFIVLPSACGTLSRVAQAIGEDGPSHPPSARASHEQQQRHKPPQPPFLSPVALYDLRPPPRVPAPATAKCVRCVLAMSPWSRAYTWEKTGSYGAMKCCSRAILAIHSLHSAGAWLWAPRARVEVGAEIGAEHEFRTARGSFTHNSARLSSGSPEPITTHSSPTGTGSGPALNAPAPHLFLTTLFSHCLRASLPNLFPIHHHPSLLQAWQPSADEMCISAQIVAGGERMLLTFDTATDRVARQREVVRAQVTLHKNAIRALRRLPPEIISEILVSALPNADPDETAPAVVPHSYLPILDRWRWAS